jgi:hypothetical protein
MCILFDHMEWFRFISYLLYITEAFYFLMRLKYCLKLGTRQKLTFDTGCICSLSEEHISNC